MTHTNLLKKKTNIKQFISQINAIENKCIGFDSLKIYAHSILMKEAEKKNLAKWIKHEENESIWLTN